ncbi:Alpha/Beta hydrolase protein [Venturia nashicola]|nr:Alpha/Beta hydrolase protein [Venturia nashicola]
MSLPKFGPPRRPIKLSYTTHSPPSPSKQLPIIFLHGLETSSLEYTHVVPFLSDEYELYLVDLPGHSGSKDIPFTLSNAIDGLAHLIKTNISGGKAHVVGLSLGGFVALSLAKQHPDLCVSVFCTGCAPPTGVRKWIMDRPWLLANFQLGINKWLPISENMFWKPIGVAPFPELREVMRGNSSCELLVAGYSACSCVLMGDLEGIGDVRVALIAGGRRDNVEGTREAGRVLRRLGGRAFVVREAVHLWDLQFPELFAAGVRAWVEGRELPGEFEVLE